MARNSTSRLWMPTRRLSRTRVAITLRPIPLPRYRRNIVRPSCPWRLVSRYLPRVTSPFATIFPSISARTLMMFPCRILSIVSESHSASSLRVTFLSNPEYNSESLSRCFSPTSPLMKDRRGSRSSRFTARRVTLVPSGVLNCL